MKSPISLILIAFSLILVSCGGGSSGTGGYSVNGRIVTPANIPLSDVVVEIRTLAGDLIASTISSADGSYEFQGIESSQFIIVVDGEEFLVSIPDGVDLVSITVTVSEEYVDFEIVFDQYLLSDEDEPFYDNGEGITIEPRNNSLKEAF